MGETLVGVGVGIAVFTLAMIFVAARHRREHLRERLIRRMHGHRLCDFTRRDH
ncbi:hypothetical protein [Paraburkholderia panacisoli]|uniref:hypothetical protein n=1 Tax=Paraburkholderia panacisoli TaxID=2603818 RepID=UPI00165F440C|nr:hypothetical protein [Paraburkholderia panacisoli]